MPKPQNSHGFDKLQAENKRPTPEQWLNHRPLLVDDWFGDEQLPFTYDYQRVLNWRNPYKKAVVERNDRGILIAAQFTW